MAKKKPIMTFQFWAKKYKIKPIVAEGVKAASGVTSTMRLGENEFKSMVDNWLSSKVKEESNG